jgi:hypothetical protein
MNFHQTRIKMNRSNDEWYSTPSSWDKILPYINKNKKIFEPFYGGGHTFKYFKKNGYKVIGNKSLDFFDDKSNKYFKKCDMIVTNPPFSTKYKILKRLVEFKKPFILILPLHCINTLSFRKSFNDDMSDVSVMIPKGRLKFIQKGVLKKSPSFESCFVCWKIDTCDKLIFL